MPRKILSKEKESIFRIYNIDEILVRVGNQYACLWIAIDSIDKVILDINISFERTILIAETFIKDLVKKYGKHPVSTDVVVHGILKLVNF